MKSCFILILCKFLLKDMNYLLASKLTPVCENLFRRTFWKIMASRRQYIYHRRGPREEVIFLCFMYLLSQWFVSVTLVGVYVTVDVDIFFSFCVRRNNLDNFGIDVLSLFLIFMC
ncbi:hypothetical protein KFK09_019004 [Dendrobium nobile]|uniref:Uncharacterized protein n=1 Tax=Dendrobium nobile TaxID=94219 RepID=A0A8T3AXD6_DENNO|nr:hypothetical protein KFK09_019004 [Dendrobium nobile]